MRAKETGIATCIADQIWQELCKLLQSTGMTLRKWRTNSVDFRKTTSRINWKCWSDAHFTTWFSKGFRHLLGCVPWHVAHFCSGHGGRNCHQNKDCVSNAQDLWYSWATSTSNHTCQADTAGLMETKGGMGWRSSGRHQGQMDSMDIRTPAPGSSSHNQEVSGRRWFNWVSFITWICWCLTTGLQSSRIHQNHLQRHQYYYGTSVFQSKSDTSDFNDCTKIRASSCSQASAIHCQATEHRNISHGIVLCWLEKSPSSLKTFVAHRIDFIQRSIPATQWKHVSSGQPAQSRNITIQTDYISTLVAWDHLGYRNPSFFLQEQSQKWKLQFHALSSIWLHLKSRMTLYGRHSPSGTCYFLDSQIQVQRQIYEV